MSVTTAKQPLLLRELYPGSMIDKVIIESVEQALFRLELEIGNQIFYVLESKNKVLSRRSIIEIQALLKPFQIASMFLRHNSPFDEMIGQQAKDKSNEMMVRIGDYFVDERPGADKPLGKVH